MLVNYIPYYLHVHIINHLDAIIIHYVTINSCPLLCIRLLIALAGAALRGRG